MNFGFQDLDAISQQVANGMPVGEARLIQLLKQLNERLVQMELTLDKLGVLVDDHEEQLAILSDIAMPDEGEDEVSH